MTPQKTTEEVLAKAEEQGNASLAEGLELAAATEPAEAAKAAPVLKPKSKLMLILAAMGPGIVTAMAGNDAGGIAAYSTLGAEFGFQGLWILPIMCVLLKNPKRIMLPRSSYVHSYPAEPSRIMTGSPSGPK